MQVDALKKDNATTRFYYAEQVESLSARLVQLATILEEADLDQSDALHAMNYERSLNVKMYQEYCSAVAEKGRISVKCEMQVSHLQTKSKLLEEALTKRNKDKEDLEDSYGQLMNVLEKYDNQITEMKEELEVKDLKINAYEERLENKSDVICIDELEERILFLVSVLEKYRKKLEEDSELAEGEEGATEGVVGQSTGKLD